MQKRDEQFWWLLFFVCVCILLMQLSFRVLGERVRETTAIRIQKKNYCCQNKERERARVIRKFHISLFPTIYWFCCCCYCCCCIPHYVVQLRFFFRCCARTVNKQTINYGKQITQAVCVKREMRKKWKEIFFSFFVQCCCNYNWVCLLNCYFFAKKKYFIVRAVSFCLYATIGNLVSSK